MLKRGSGILLHISSLPSEYGIGDIGKNAHMFADILKAAGQRYWQMLPLNPTDAVYGESPYSSPSAFACNPMFVSPDLLCGSGLLDKEDLALTDPFPPGKIEFAKACAFKDQLFEKAFLNFQASGKMRPEYDEFCRRESFWLDDHAMFIAFKELHKGKRWDLWEEPLKTRQPKALKNIENQYHERIEYFKFLQFLFSLQWDALRAHCNEMDIKLIGDIPIYVNDDSVDVWANPQFFKLNNKMRPTCVAGVPPDYFSETGQRWGNPVYEWEKLKADGYAWWMKRLKRQFELFDIVRIDHFRGLLAYWEVPASEKTAVNGKWADGPKDEFFHAIQKQFSGLPIIGEDLGIITPDVTELMERFEIPGMKVLQFAFSGDLSTHPYIPDNYIDNCVVYTGTHDNNTTRGWFEHDASDEERNHLREYLHKDVSKETIVQDLMGLALSSRAVLAIIPLQDIMDLGKEARMNIPGTSSGNWLWRYEASQLSEESIEALRGLTEKTGRL